jgi:hypothetical protein
VISRIGAAALWTSAAILLIDSDGDGALVLALAALPATAIALAIPHRRAGGFVVIALVASALASATGRVAQVFPWDDIEHALLALSFCWLLIDLLRPVAAPWWLIASAAVGVTLTCSIAWEVVEWVADQALNTRMSPSDADTIGDLVADLLGCGAAIAVLALGRAHRPRNRGLRPDSRHTHGAEIRAEEGGSA